MMSEIGLSPILSTRSTSCCCTWIEKAGFLALGDQQLQFLWRMKGGFARSGTKTDGAEHQVAQAVENEDCRFEQGEEQTERPDDGERRSLAAL